MSDVKSMLENKLDNIYLKISNPYAPYKHELLELQKETEKTNDILKLQLIMRQVEKIHKTVRDM